MKTNFAYAFVFVLLLAFSAYPQNYSKLEKLADDLKDQAEKIADRTNDNLSNNGVNPGDVVEQMFTAEQILASAEAFEKMVNKN